MHSAPIIVETGELPNGEFRFTVRSHGEVVFETTSPTAARRWLLDFVPTMTDDEMVSFLRQIGAATSGDAS